MTSCPASFVLLLAAACVAGCSTGRRGPDAPAPAGSAPPGHAHAHAHAHGHAEGPLVHRFEGAAKWSEVFDDPARDAWQKPDEVVRLLELTAGMTVADVGAGTGYFEARLSRAVGPTGRVLALDVEPDMVEWMRARAAREGLANVEARLIPLDDPSLPEGKVDRVVVVDTWHHVAERERYAARLRAALAPGGRVAIVDFDLDAPEGPPREHRLAPEAVVRELAAAGLVAAAVDEPLPHQYVVVGRRP